MLISAFHWGPLKSLSEEKTRISKTWNHYSSRLSRSALYYTFEKDICLYWGYFNHVCVSKRERDRHMIISVSDPESRVSLNCTSPEPNNLFFLKNQSPCLQGILPSIKGSVFCGPDKATWYKVNWRIPSMGAVVYVWNGSSLVWMAHWVAQEIWSFVFPLCWGKWKKIFFPGFPSHWYDPSLPPHFLTT